MPSIDWRRRYECDISKDVDWLVIAIQNQGPKAKKMIPFGLKIDIAEPTFSSDLLQIIA
jgi:hypothetical protein